MITNATDYARNSPHSFADQVRRSTDVWWHTLRPCFWLALISATFSQLPWLPWWWKTRALFASDPLQAWLSPTLFVPGVMEGSLALLVSLASLLFFLAMIRLQGRYLQGTRESATLSLKNTWRRFPATLGVSVTYTILLLLSLLPVGIAFFLGLHAEEPLFLPLFLLIGLLLSALPLTWISIAAAFVYPPVLLENTPLFAAQRQSFRLVHGQWVMAAVLVSLGLFAAIGLLGTVGALPFLLTGSIAASMNGVEALLRPGWLVFGQLLSVPLMAVFFPMATATYCVAYEELCLRSLQQQGNALDQASQQKA